MDGLLWKLYLLSVIAYWIGGIGVYGADSFDHELNVLEQQYRLFSHLLNTSRYNPRCDPTVLKAVDISYYLEFHQMLSMDESTQTVRMSVWMQQDWKDAQLFWNPAEFGNITNIATPYEDVWRPPLYLTNSVEFDAATTDQPTIVLLTMDMAKDSQRAAVMFGYHALFKFSCPINMLYFPFDVQKCIMTFEPVLDVKRIRYTLANESVNLDIYKQNEEWTLLKARLVVTDNYYSTTPVPFSLITATFYLQRRPMYYVSSLILPMILISLFASIGLFVPVDTPECTYDKLSLGMTALLTFSIQLLQVSSQVPKGSSTVPLLSWLFLGLMTQITIGTLIAVWLCDPSNCEKVKKFCTSLKCCFRLCRRGGQTHPERHQQGFYPSLKKPRPSIFILNPTNRKVVPARERGHATGAQGDTLFAHMLFMAMSVFTTLGLLGGIFIMSDAAMVD